MTDWHAHILPAIDDGARNIEESLRLIKSSAAQGITRIIATPHFYAHENTLSGFLKRRLSAWDEIREEIPASAPEILMGAEVYYFDGISRAEGMPKLCTEGTDILLLEMPFTRWKSGVVREVLDLNARDGIKVMLAHIERYAAYYKAAELDAMRREGVLIQTNAEFFLARRTRRRALEMFRNGMIDALGSDCHNMSERPPRLGEAFDLIRNDLGEFAVNDFCAGNDDLFNK